MHTAKQSVRFVKEAATIVFIRHSLKFHQYQTRRQNPILVSPPYIPIYEASISVALVELVTIETDNHVPTCYHCQPGPIAIGCRVRLGHQWQDLNWNPAMGRGQL